MKITKKQFKSYVDVQKSGITNMWNIKLTKGIYSLNLYSQDFNNFEGEHFKVYAYDLEELKDYIKEVLK